MRALGRSFLFLMWMEPLGRPKLSLEGEPQLPSMLPPCWVKNSESLPEVGAKGVQAKHSPGPQHPSSLLRPQFPQ